MLVQGAISIIRLMPGSSITNDLHEHIVRTIPVIPVFFVRATISEIVIISYLWTTTNLKLI